MTGENVSRGTRRRNNGTALAKPSLTPHILAVGHGRIDLAKHLSDERGARRGDGLAFGWTSHVRPLVPIRANGGIRANDGAKEPRKEDGGGNGNGNGEDGRGSGTAVITRTRTQTRRPGMYRVLLLNDDYTPMEFVVAVLRKYFSKGPEEATRIMLHVHQHGVGECGVFTYEVAETKVTQVMDYARKHQHPLQCIMEKK